MTGLTLDSQPWAKPGLTSAPLGAEKLRAVLGSLDWGGRSCKFLAFAGSHIFSPLSRIEINGSLLELTKPRQSFQLTSVMFNTVCAEFRAAPPDSLMTMAPITCNIRQPHFSQERTSLQSSSAWPCHNRRLAEKPHLVTIVAI